MMPLSISQEEIDSLRERCRTDLEQLYFPAGQSGARRLDAAILLDTLAWKVLVPVLVSVTGGLVTDKVRKLRDAGANAHKAEASAAVGKPIQQIQSQDRTACVDAVEIVIRDLGGTRHQAEAIVAAILQHLEHRTPAPPAKGTTGAAD